MTEIKVRLSGTNLERAADHNQRVVLHAIRVHRTVTRVALSNITGLTAPAVANIVRRLTDDGLIVEAGRLRSGRGQPGKVLEINPKARYSFGINIDRDHVSFVLVNFLGEIHAQRHWERAFTLPEDVRQLWLKNVHDMMAEGDVAETALCGIGIAIPDGIDTLPAAIPPRDYAAWNAVDPQRLFEQPFDVPVFLENDAKAAALGEQQFGSGARYSSSLYLLISSGLGGAFLVDGQVMRGANNRSGEIGLIPVGKDELLQDWVSLAGMDRHLQAHGLALADLFDAPGDPRFADAIDIWLEKATAKMLPALVATNCLLNPAAILIGSRLPAVVTQRLAQSMQTALRSAFPGLPSYAQIEMAALTGNAAAIGAALLPFIQLYLPVENMLWKGD